MSYPSSSKIIDHLNAKNDSANSIGIAYVYCDYKEKSSQSFESLPANLLKQLIRFAPRDYIQNLKLLYRLKSHESNFLFDDASELLRELIDEIGKVYIVIDALDEIEDDSTRDSLVVFMVDLQASNSDAHILIMSRSEQTAVECFPGAALLELAAKESDIRAYVSGRTETELRLQRQIKQPPALKQNIIDAIAVNCQGMFLLARIHVDWIARARTLADLEHSLQTLPTGPNGLNQTYGEAMERIQAQDNRDADSANRILTWLCFSLRPLRVEELRWALAVDLSNGEEDFNERRLLSREDIILLCAGLVMIDAESEEVRLVHFTTQEFFISQRDRLFPDAKLILASTCIRFLSYSRFRKPRCESRDAIEEIKKSNPFLEYAATKLGDHAQPVEKQVMSQILSLMRHDACLDCINQIGKGLLDSTGGKLLLGRLETALQYGLKYVLAVLLSEGSDDVKEFYRTFPVHVAIREGQSEIIEILIQSGVDLHVRDGILNTALHAVAVYNHPLRENIGHITRMILDKLLRHLNTGTHYARLHFMMPQRVIMLPSERCLYPMVLNLTL